nr:MAG TPA: hypothetical protein [Caudoviricetes sp.]
MLINRVIYIKNCRLNYIGIRHYFLNRKIFYIKFG